MPVESGNLNFDLAFQAVPLYALALTRVTAMMIFAPLFGSARVSIQVKVMLAIVMALAVMPVLPVGSAARVESIWDLSLAMGGEVLIGLALGTTMAMVFIAAQWGGELVGQQLGFNLSEVLDPQFGAQSTVMGDFYFMLTLVIFLCVGGHHALIWGVRESFETVPVLGAAVTRDVLEVMLGTLSSATMLAFRLAAPVMVTMLVVDVCLGFLAKTMPQLNILSAGLSLKSVVGLLIVMAGLSLTADVLGTAIDDASELVRRFYNLATPPAQAVIGNTHSEGGVNLG